VNSHLLTLYIYRVTRPPPTPSPLSLLGPVVLSTVPSWMRPLSLPSLLRIWKQLVLKPLRLKIR
jgi:hypothetical protein